MPVSQFHWERDFWNAGYDLVAGVDEVGRGALAGPLVAAAVIFDMAAIGTRSRREKILASVRDSKLMTRQARETSLVVIERCSTNIGIGMVECQEIDALGMTAANRLAMERAVFGLGCEPSALLLDAFVTDLDLPQVGLIDGDARCLSIAAASIVAKVTRDRLMCALHCEDSRYGLDQHVGYGTPEHLRALKLHGPANFHRRSFRPVQECLNHQ
ncbi:MAG TPA: ribonuclease HII [Thermomicrobiales bacterium]|nr:ribonuclease HII [Thermomicrobiales bacterium]